MLAYPENSFYKIGYYKTSMMLQDFKMSLKNWRLIHLLGVSNLRTRYSRSKLGQYWLTVSLFIQIMMTGIVWSVLWHMPLREFLPYVAISQTVYQFFSTTIQDSSSLFVNDHRLYINQRLPFITSTFSNLYKNCIIFFHNLPIILLMLLWSTTAHHLTYTMLIIIPLALIFLKCSSYVISSICTRYRDLQQIVHSLLTISFLVTPIMWKLSYIPEHLQQYFFLNPFAGFLEALRNPLLDIPVSPLAYDAILIWTALSIISMFYMYNRFEKRIILWI